MKLGYLATGSNGTTVFMFDPKAHPRRQLLAKLGASSVRKIYVDSKDGTTKHVGYIVGNEWFNVYEVHEWVGGKL